jgi:hypothetical protein
MDVFNTCSHCLHVVPKADIHDDPHVNQYPDALNRRPLGNREGRAVIDRMKKQLVFLAIFLAFLLYFVWNSSWHLPSQLVIRGQIESPADVRVSWDSGSGFNDMESADLVFGKPVEANVRSGVVRIRRIGKSHPAAQSAEVWIKLLKLSEDEHAKTLQAFAQQKGTEMTAEGYLHLRADGAELQVPAGKDYTAICFVANEYAGFVEIDLDGDKRLYDLYAAQHQDKWVERKGKIFAPGNFKAIVNLPRYDIHRLQIVSVEALQAFRLESIVISSKKGEVSLPLIGSGLLSSIGFSDFSRNTRQYFHPIHFLQQILFALLSAWLALSVFRFIRSRGGIIRVLSEGKRPAFWLMLAGGLVAFSGWLFVYWPGHFTSDSVHIWWAARKPGYFLFQHPVMNVIFYRFLQQFWDNFAIVGICQIAATAALGAYIFYFLYKNGVCLWVVLPCYLAFITSVPVGLYSISLWKDIPFALLVLTWAFYFMKAAGEKRGYVRFSRQEVLFLTLLLFALALFRYNGIVYLLLIPLGMVLFGMLPWRKILAGLAVVSVIASAILGISIALDKTNFVSSQARVFLNRMHTNGFLVTGMMVLKQYPTILDINTYKKKHIWYDVWYRDRQVTDWHYNFAKEKGYDQFVRYEPCEPKIKWLHTFLDRINRGSYEEPWVYLTWNPFYMLFLFLFAFFPCLFPRTAAFGYVVLSQVLVLLCILGPYNYNWRYYYFLLFSLYFLIPVIALDVQCLWRRFRVREREGQKGRWLLCRRSA